MFKSATIKLTIWYLALMMGLSLAFSAVLYRSSTDSLRDGFEHQRMVIRQQYQSYFGIKLSPFDVDRLRNTEVDQASQRLLANLTLANVAVLIVGGATSFYMARRTLRPIEQSMESQARFTADASHELRTPLTAMQTEIEVALRDRNLPATEARQLLESNLEEVKKLQELSNGLLALANQDEDHFIAKPLSIKPIVRSATERIQPMAEQKEITIVNTIQALRILGDKDALTQLFAILLDNAVKYSPSQTTIKIVSHAKGGYAHIAVVDQGDGIKADDLPHIFDRLYRADGARTKAKIEGYGLGLSIAKKIIELHKGTIEVTSKVGKGSTFTARIPVAPKAHSET